MRASAVRVFHAVNGNPTPRARALTLDDELAPDREAATATGPGLTQVSMRWARAACRNHLKQEGTYELAPPCPLPSKANAKAKGGTGGKEEIEAWERGLRAVGGAFERRYRFVLR
jgi:hypothetical protein